MKSNVSTCNRAANMRRPFTGGLAWPLAIAIAAAFLHLGSLQAATFTYEPTNATTDQWSAGTNWTAVPVSASDTTLTFVANNATAFADGFNNSSNNDIVGNFSLNILNLQGTGPTTGSANISLTGDPLNFVSNAALAPRINLNATSTTINKITYTIDNNVILTNNLTLSHPGRANLTFNGVISGAGSLTVLGGGVTLNTMRMTNNNSSFSGLINLNSGNLLFPSIGNYGVNSAVGTGGTTSVIDLRGSSAFVYTGTTDAETNRRFTFQGNASSLAHTGGSGTLTFTSDYGTIPGGLSTTGGFVTNAGTGGVIHLSGNYVHAQGLANTATYSAVGVGGINRLTGTNQFGGTVGLAGGATVEFNTIADGGVASALGAGSAAATTITIQNNGMLRYIGATDSTSNRLFSFQSNTNNATITLDASGAGALNMNGTDPIIETLSANQARNLILTGTSTANNRFSPLLQNNGTGLLNVTKNGQGKWTLAGNNIYTGTTSVNAGTLFVTGSMSAATGAVSVASGATLGGIGTLGGATTVIGRMSPGESIGTLNIANDVTWVGAATAGTNTDWVFELAPGDISDLLDITGNFNKSGAGLNHRFDFAASTATGLFTLVEWSGTSNFTADNFSYTNYAGAGPGTFILNSNSLQLHVVPEPSTGVLVAGSLIVVGLIRRRR